MAHVPSCRDFPYWTLAVRYRNQLRLEMACTVCWPRLHWLWMGLLWRFEHGVLDGRISGHGLGRHGGRSDNKQLNRARLHVHCFRLDRSERCPRHLYRYWSIGVCVHNDDAADDDLGEDFSKVDS